MTTPATSVTYTGDGTTASFAIPFEFLNRSHVNVFLNGATSTDFVWTAPATIRFNTAPAAAVVILIQRNTPIDTPISNFTAGNLSSDSLNRAEKQALFAMQEFTQRDNPPVPASDSDVSAGTDRTKFVTPASLANGFAYAATGAPAVRKASDRANDFTRLDDYIPIGVGMGRKDAYTTAKNALVAKGGGRLLLGGGITDLGAGSMSLTSNKVIISGDGQSIIQSTASSGPIVALGDGVVQLNSSGIEGTHVFANSTTDRGQEPIVWVRNGWETILDHVAVHANGNNATVNGGVGFLIDGGTSNGGNYNTRLIAPRGYGPLYHGMVVGRNAMVVGLYVDGGFSFGSTLDDGIIVYNVDGCILRHGEILSAGGNALTFEPGAGQHANCVQLSDLQLDTAVKCGLLLKDTGGYIFNVIGTNIWCCSHGQTALFGGYAEGLRIEGSVAPDGSDTWAHVSDIGFHNSIVGNNGAGGITTINVDGVDLVGVHANGNGVKTTAMGMFLGSGSRNIRVSGGSAKGRFYAGFPKLQAYGAAIDHGADYVSFSGYTDLSDNISGPLSSNFATNYNVVPNVGYRS
jgi:hypothetical protein